MKALRVFGALSLLFIIGLLFKMMWWPGTGPLIILGAFFFIAFYLPLSFIHEKRQGENLAYLIFKTIVFALVSIGIVFKIMHWPWAGILSNTSSILWFLGFIPVFIFRLLKHTPDKYQKTSKLIYFLLINALFFNFQFSSRNYNVNIFEIETGVITNTQKTIRKNELILETIQNVGNDSLQAVAQKVHFKTDSINGFLVDLRNKLIAACDEIEEKEASLITNNDVRRKNCVDIPSRLLIGEVTNPDTGNYSGYDVKKHIRSYLSFLGTIPKETDRKFFKEGLNLNTDDITWTEEDAEYSESWESFYFMNMPLSAILTKLENLKYDIRLAENQALQYILNSAYTSRNTGISTKINDLVEKQEMTEKQKELEELKKEKQFYNTKMVEKNEKVEEQSRSLVIIIFVVIGAICLLILTINSNNERKKANALLARQKEYIEHQKQEITDSINYANRIQKAILPTKESITTAFPQSFILYKPKDIVSGDFYWFTENTNGYLIAAADCTGHGVPGAFMSVISSEKLTEASLITSNVSELLHQTNLGIKRTLRQTESQDSTRDGMDICMCHFNKELSTVTYAGANRPLWLIRKNSNVITDIKATKSAIGGLTMDEQQFDSNLLQLNEGDTLYLFTDGFADQFSQMDKKMMTKKFKETILSIQHLNMNDQEQYLNNFHSEWKGNMEQTDDVLVIGIRA